MKREFQVIYRQSGGPLLAIQVIADKAEEAAAVVQSQADLSLVAVQEGLPVVDWSKPVYDRQELAAAFSRSDDFVPRQQAAGKFPKTPNGMPFFSNKVPLRYVEEGKAA